MANFKCKMCGGLLNIFDNTTTTICEYCGSEQTLPNLRTPDIERLYERANHLRTANNYDKAKDIYEEILKINDDDSESYWSIVLCDYGIEYIDDPKTHKMIPTINRMQFTSIYDDDNYQQAIKYADISQKILYENEAKKINEIQKSILEISRSEEPYDVFICYKQSDEKGNPTPDSLYANQLYYELKKEGIKAFYAKLTLKDKPGRAYEPFIFSALNTSKIMVVIGTKQEYFNAVWVKNEWSRFLQQIKKGEKKTLIAAYKDMSAYNLPKEFSHLQALDMNDITFMMDLVRGISQILNKDTNKNKEKYQTSNANISQEVPLLKRIALFLEDNDWDNALNYCEKVLDINPECSQAYIYKLLIELRFQKEEMLIKSKKHLEEYANFRKALRFANEIQKQKLLGYQKAVNDILYENNKIKSSIENILSLDKIDDDKRKLKENSISKEIEMLKNSTSLLNSEINKLENYNNDIFIENSNIKNNRKIIICSVVFFIATVLFIFMAILFKVVYLIILSYMCFSMYAIISSYYLIKIKKYSIIKAIMSSFVLIILFYYVKDKNKTKTNIQNINHNLSSIEQIKEKINNNNNLIRIKTKEKEKLTYFNTINNICDLEIFNNCEKIELDNYFFFKYDHEYILASINNNDNMKEIILPENVNSNKYAIYRGFIKNSNVETVNIGNGVYYIGKFGFYGCKKLKTIEIGNYVRYIDNYAFGDCCNLMKITYGGTIKEWENIYKGSGWDSNVGLYIIHCTDGDITKS